MIFSPQKKNYIFIFFLIYFLLLVNKNLIMLLYICYKEFSGYDCIKSEQWKLSSCKLCVFMIGMSMVQKVIGQYEQCQAVNGKLEACYLCDGSLRELPLV